MKSRTVLATALLMSLSLLGSVACAQQPTRSTPPDHSARSAASMEMHQAMMQGASMSMPMTGDPDTDFATMMTMHHRQAIAMIDVYLKHGNHADLMALARRMKETQQDEIAVMAPHTK